MAYENLKQLIYLFSTEAIKTELSNRNTYSNVGGEALEAISKITIDHEEITAMTQDLVFAISKLQAFIGPSGFTSGHASALAQVAYGKNEKELGDAFTHLRQYVNGAITDLQNEIARRQEKDTEITTKSLNLDSAIEDYVLTANSWKAKLNAKKVQDIKAAIRGKKAEKKAEKIDEHVKKDIQKGDNTKIIAEHVKKDFENVLRAVKELFFEDILKSLKEIFDLSRELTSEQRLGLITALRTYLTGELPTEFKAILGDAWKQKGFEEPKTIEALLTMHRKPSFLSPKEPDSAKLLTEIRSLLDDKEKLLRFQLVEKPANEAKAPRPAK